MKIAIVLAMLCATACMGQQTKQVVACAGTSDGHCQPIEPPLTFVSGPSITCDPKFEYVAFGSTKEHPEMHEMCAPLLHTVTEKEWVELKERLRVLEIQRKAGLRGTLIGEQCLHDLGVCTDRMDTAHKMVQNMIDDMAKRHP